MPNIKNIAQNQFSRMWLIPNTAGPANAPSYEGLWKAGSADFPLGDVTKIWIPDPDQYGEFAVAGKIIGERGAPTLSLQAKYEMDRKSTLLRLARLGCDHDLQVHLGRCKDPQDFNAGWEKILVLEQARPTNWGTDDLGAFQPSDRATVTEDTPWSGTEIFEILPMAYGEKASAETEREIVDISVCDSVNCGACGIVSNGCDKVFALTITVAGSPGLAAEIVWSDDGGDTWDDSTITTLSASEDPNALACVGTNLVVISEDSESLHYASLAGILAGTETWTEVSTGFVATKGPLAIYSADPRHTWIVAEGGYVYFTADPTGGVTVQDAGVVTAQNLKAIHGIDNLNMVAVGVSNAVIVTSNGGDTWSAITGPAVGVDLNSVWMKTKDIWFILTNGGKLFYTINAGQTWTEKTFPGSGAGIGYSIKFVDSPSQTVGYMSHSTATPVGRILRTVDGGNSWYVAPEANLPMPTNLRITALAVCDKEANVVYGGGLKSGVDGIIVKGSAEA